MNSGLPAKLNGESNVMTGEQDVMHYLVAYAKHAVLAIIEHWSLTIRTVTELNIVGKEFTVVNCITKFYKVALAKMISNCFVRTAIQ